MTLILTGNCFQPYKRVNSELSVEGDCLLGGTRVIVPLKLGKRYWKNIYGFAINHGFARTEYKLVRHVISGKSACLKWLL